ncbi:MAG: heliorhodopsin HeR [Chloroflexota bacterium]
MATAKKSALKGAAASSSGVATSFAAIPAARAKQLFNWNRALVVLHGIQAAIIWWISPTDALVRFEGTYPVSKIVDGQFAGLESAKELLISFPLAYLVAAFFLLSALAHFLVAFPLRKRYEGWLAREFNPMRWAEYALSSTLMILGIASLSFVTDAGALIAIAVCNASMNLFGWSMEEANIGRKNVQWSHYIFGCIAGIAPWLALFTSVGLSLANWPTGVGPNGRSLEEFKPVLIAIYVSLFISFNIFAVNMVLQRLKVGKWADYLHGERSYMILSLVAKTLLAWQVWTGVFMPA